MLKFIISSSWYKIIKYFDSLIINIYSYMQNLVRNLKILTSQISISFFLINTNSRIARHNHVSESSQTWLFCWDNRFIHFKNVEVDRSKETSQKTSFSDLHIFSSSSIVLIIILVFASILDSLIAINFISFIFFYHQCHSSAKWKSREQRFVH